MKHIKKINEFVRTGTAGFRYSEPIELVDVSFYYIGEITKEQVESVLTHMDLKYDSVEVGNDEITININKPEGPEEVKCDGYVKFDIFVYNPKDTNGLIFDFIKKISYKYNIEVIDIRANEKF